MATGLPLEHAACNTGGVVDQALWLAYVGFVGIDRALEDASPVAFTRALGSAGGGAFDLKLGTTGGVLGRDVVAARSSRLMAS